jgi:ABC-type nitrate/sulfonate/bicarbonate transport system substrate-binding protein
MTISISGASSSVANEIRLPVFAPQRSDFGTAGIEAGLSADGFSRLGLTIELIKTATDEATVERVVSSSFAIGLISATSFLRARARGAPIVAFGAGYFEMPVAFCVSDSSQIRQPADFIGKKVGYGPGDDEKVAYDIMMLKLRLPQSQISIVGLTGNTIPLSGDTVDVWPVRFGQAIALLYESGVRFRMIKPADFGVHVLGTVYFSNQSALRQAPDSFIRFMQGVIDGWDMTYKEPSKQTYRPDNTEKPYGDATIKFVLDQQRSYLRPFGLRIGEFGREDWKATQSSLAGIQLLAQPLDISQLANFDIVKEAYRKMSR